VPGGEQAAARAQVQGAATLVTLAVRVDEELTAFGEVRSVWRNFWAGRAPLQAGPAVVVAASVPPDAAARLLRNSARGRASLVLDLDPEPLARFPERTAALTAGDIDGDGRTEIVVLVGSEVQVLDQSGRLRARRSLLDLPAAAAPAREPFGTLCLGPSRVDVAWARAATGISLLLRGDALVPSGESVEGPSLGCGVPASFLPGAARLQSPAVPGVGPVWGGNPRLLLFPDGTARWTTEFPRRELRLKDVGAGAALFSPGGLGETVAASTAAANPSEDQLRLWGERGWGPSVVVPGRILQVRSTTMDGVPVLVLGVWTRGGGSELRIVRSAR